MNRLCTTCAAGVILLSSAGVHAAGIEFSSQEGRFSVLLPHQPKMSDSVVNGVHSYSYRANGGCVYFHINYADTPIEVEVNIVLDSLVKKLGEDQHELMSDQHELTSFERAPGDELPAAKYNIQFKYKGVHWEERGIIIGESNRSYIFGAVMLLQCDDQGMFDRFVASIKLMP